MASPKTRRVLKEVKETNDNKRCLDCNTLNPQWVSVSHGIWMCLECSGKHRGLGVHISFVRSVTMDKWKDTELKKMKVGGNKKAREFLQSQSDWDETESFQQRYNSKAAALLRDKVSTEAKGELWSLATSAAKDYVPHNASSNSLRTSVNSSSNLRGSETSSSNDLESFYGMSKEEISRKKEDFFERKKMENETKSTELPPSQGGKYVGFGSAPIEPQKKDDDLMASLSSGWASFTVGATKLASTVSEKATKLGATVSEKSKEVGSSLSEKVKEGKIGESAKSSFSVLGSKVTAGWNDISTMFSDGHKHKALPDRDESSGLTQTGTSEAKSSSEGGGWSWGEWMGGDTKSQNTKPEESGWTGWTSGSKSKSAASKPDTSGYTALDSEGKDDEDNWLDADDDQWEKNWNAQVGGATAVATPQDITQPPPAAKNTDDFESYNPLSKVAAKPKSKSSDDDLWEMLNN